MEVSLTNTPISPVRTNIPMVVALSPVVLIFGVAAIAKTLSFAEFQATLELSMLFPVWLIPNRVLAQ